MEDEVILNHLQTLQNAIRQLGLDLEKEVAAREYSEKYFKAQLDSWRNG